MSGTPKIIQAREEKGGICENILRSLPQWFGIEESILQYVQEVEGMPMYVALIHESVVGFLSLKHHTEFCSEIYVMGVLPDFHHQGIGKLLVAKTEAYLRAKDIKYLQVKTQGNSRTETPYDRTRKFYLSQGFLPIEEIIGLWGENNPCLLMIKEIYPNHA
jgi:ribosomal protein S18 acetylase RimI-like enzyme